MPLTHHIIITYHPEKERGETNSAEPSLSLALYRRKEEYDKKR
jgi:hypothetical protein